MTGTTRLGTEPADRPGLADAREQAVQARLEELLGPVPEWSRNLVEALVASFLARAMDYLLALEEAIPAGDLDAVTRHSHGLKGMASNLGAVDLAALGDVLEYCGRSGQLATAPKLLVELYAELEAVRPALLRVTHLSSGMD